MPTCETLLLYPDRPLRLEAARHAEVHVEAGIVWITSGPAAGDLFLLAGDCYRVPGTGVVLVEGVRGTATVRLVTKPRRSVSALVDSLRDMLPKGLATS